MDRSEKMFDWDQEWNISFAGCGFRSIYYLGAMSCFLERLPRLVHGASKICGASSGCLVAAALTVGFPIEQFCVDVLSIAEDARKHTLGVFHPTFSLLRSVRDSLLQKLPADAHLQASRRLCVSLTRLRDGKNILVSEFDSREELIQVLICSCFFPVYCGFTPPSYRGEHYMDGALSNNMPLFEQRNTITLAPFSGESDICPREGTFNFFEAHYGNVSIQVNTGNVHRVCTSFLPTRPQTLAEICHNGYLDALCFLRERDLIAQGPPSSLPTKAESGTVRASCCELAETETTPLNGQEPHWWLDRKVIENLPVSFRKVLCKWCREHPDTKTQFFPVRVVLFLLSILLLLPVELIFLLVESLVLSSCSVICRLLTMTVDFCRQIWIQDVKVPNSVFPGQRCTPSTSDLLTKVGERKNFKPVTSNGKKTLHWDNNRNLALFSCTSTCTSPCNFHINTNTPACSKESNHNHGELNHRIKKTLYQL